MGVNYENRERSFLLLGEKLDVRIYLEREPDNPYDPNAIKVMGIASVKGSITVLQLGYLSRETAKELVNYQDLDATPR